MALKQQNLIYGIHAVSSALRSRPQQVRELWIEQSRQDERTRLLLETAQARNIVVHLVKAKTLDRMLDHAAHQGVVAHCRQAPMLQDKQLEAALQQQTSPFYLVLDGVKDPHNLGACLRTGDAAGVDGVIVPRDRAVGVTPAVRKVASGAAETVPLYQVANLARAMEKMKAGGVWLIGLAGEAAQSLYQADLRGPLALVLGAEQKGLRRLTRDKCDLLVSLPMAGEVESLNVSVAAGICLYEALRQRKHIV